MASQAFTITYRVNEGLCFSPSELLQHYLYGIDVRGRDGKGLSESIIRQKILAAQKQLSELIAIKFFREIFEQSIDFNRNDYFSWSFIKTSFPVRQPLALSGFLGNVRQIQYPLSWLSMAKSSDERFYSHNIHIIPAGSTATTQSSSVVFSGITPHLGFMGVDNIPNYWTIKYVTGFKDIPESIMDAIGKMAAIQLLAMLGDIVLGAGISSMSLSIDSLSQSVTKSSGSAFSERIRQYQQDLQNQLSDLKYEYKGINFEVV